MNKVEIITYENETVIIVDGVKIHNINEYEIKNIGTEVPTIILQ